MKYSVYMILSKVNNRLISYVGYTNNLQKRLNLHNSGLGAKFTRGRKWKIIYKKRYKNKSDAMKDEYKIKNNKILRAKIKSKYLKNLK